MADYIYPYGDAPDDAEYVLGEANQDLPNGLVILPGPGISISQGPGTITVTNTGGSDTSEQSYWTADDETGTLPNSFKVEAGTNISIDYTPGTVTISASGGSGGGSVNSFGANNGSPLFNTSVTNPTTDPVLSFNMTSSVINALATGLSGTGYVTQNGTTFVDRTLTGSSNISVTNGDGTGGNPVWDVTPRVFTVATSALLNALSSSTAGGTGGIYQLSDTAFINRSLTGTANRVVITNPSGIAGAPTFDVGSDVYTISSSNVLNDLATSTSTGIVVQSDAAGHHVYRSVTGTGNRITVTNGSGVGANPTVDLGTDAYTISSSNILNDLASSTGVGLVAQTDSVGHHAFRTLQGTTNRVTVANGSGASTNPSIDVGSDVYTISSSNVLNDLASSTSTGIVVQSDSVGHHVYRQIDGTAGEINVTNPTGVGANPTLSLDSSVYTDRDSSVLNALATGLTGTGFVSQNGAQFYDRTLTGTSNRLTITNPTGAAGDPVFDVGTDVIVVGDITALPGIQVVNGSGTIQIGASGAQGGTLTDLTVGDISPVWATNVANSTTTPAVTYTLNNFASGAVLIGPKVGADAPATLRRILGQDILDAISAGSNVSLALVGDSIQISSTAGGTGTVTDVSVSDLLPLFTTVVNTSTTTPDVQYTLSNASSGTFFAGPASGGPAPGSYRTITGLDLIPALSAGTNITLTMVGDHLQISLAGPIDAALIANGSVSNTEFQYLDGVTSGIQGQLNAKQPLDSILTSLTSTPGDGAIPIGDTGVYTPAVPLAGEGIQLDTGAGFLTILASGALGGTLTDFIIGDANPLFSTDATNTTSVPNVSFTLGQAASATFWRGSASGGPSTASFGGVLGTDLTGALEAGSNITITPAAEPGSRLIIAATGSSGYSTIEEEGTPLTQRDTINFVGDGITAADVASKTQVSLDATLNSLATFSATGIMVSQGSDTFVGREIIGTPNQVTVAQGNGIPGDIIIGLDSGINTNLLADGSVSDAEFQYLDGATSNIQSQLDQKQPLSNTLNALSTGLSGTGYVIQDGPNSFVERSLTTANSNHISITNPDGVAGASTFAIGSDVFTLSTSNILNRLASSVPTDGQIPIGDGVNFQIAAPFAGPGIQITTGAGTLQFLSSGAANALITAGDLAPLFTTTESANNLSFTLSNFASGTYFGGPSSGAASAPAVQSLTPGAITSNFVNCGLFIDGASAVVSPGEVGLLNVDFNGTIVGWEVLSLQSASITLNVHKSTYSSFPAMVSMVGAGTKPNTSSSYKGQWLSPLDWTTDTITAGDVLKFVLESNDLSQGFAITLKILRTS